MIAWSTAANAVPVRWEFVSTTGAMCEYDGVYPECNEPVFVGVSLSGSFVYDADIGVFSDVDVYGGANGSHFTSAFFDWDTAEPFEDGTFYLDAYTNEWTQTYLGLNVGALTNAGGTVTISGATERNCYPSEFFSDCQDPAYLGYYTGSISGSVVPIPAAIWLLGSGLAGLGWLRRKQTA